MTTYTNWKICGVMDLSRSYRKRIACKLAIFIILGFRIQSLGENWYHNISNPALLTRNLLKPLRIFCLEGVTNTLHVSKYLKMNNNINVDGFLNTTFPAKCAKLIDYNLGHTLYFSIFMFAEMGINQGMYKRQDSPHNVISKNQRKVHISER